MSFITMLQTWINNDDLSIDHYDVNDHTIIVVDVPGVKPEDINIKATPYFELIIKTNRNLSIPTPLNTYTYVQNLQYGERVRTIQLSKNVDLQKIETQLENGVLTIKIAKRILGDGITVPVVNIKNNQNL
jgi:HSP20 family molecular chaperone IbpA